jgi:hypothetical protein
LWHEKVSTEETKDKNCLEWCFLFGPCEVVINKSSAENSQSSSGVPSEGLVESWALQGRLRRDGAIVELTVAKSWVSGCSPGSIDVSTEPEESPLLEAVARERCWRHSMLEEGLTGAVVIYKMWGLAIALWLLIVPSHVYKWSVNSFTNLYPVSTHALKIVTIMKRQSFNIFYHYDFIALEVAIQVW